jgi:3-hydroxyisobutyrate dehydrogenase
MTPHTTSAPGPIGFVGLGLLGQAIALRLARQGFPLVVWNREPERSVALVEAGAVLAASPQDVARQCAVVCLCVIDGAAVRDVVFGPQGLVQAARVPRTVIDFSTVDPGETRAIAAQAAEAGLQWIDAPVSGGPTAAVSGQLTLMCGGDAQTLERVQPALAALASRRTHVGAVGSGQEMKVLNQALVGATTVMLAEVLTLARSLGVPLELVPSCLEGGMADSVGLQRIWPRMAAEQYQPPTGRASQLLKDLENVDTLRAGSGLALPLVQAAVAQFRTYVNDQGAGDADSFSIPLLYSLRDNPHRS